MPQEVFKAYREKHPKVEIEVLESNNMITFPKMVATKRTTPDRPLVHCGFFNVNSITKGDVEDIWAKLDPARVPNMNKVLKDFVRPEGRGVGYMMSAIGILYNKNAMKEPPTSWADLWNPANRGRVTMFDYDARALAIAARLNGGSEKNPDPGFKVWSDNATNLRALVDSNDAVKNLVSSGDAWMAPWFSNIAKVWIEEGAPLGLAIPKEGAIAFPLFLAMVNGVTPAQQAVCEDLINELLSAENSGRYGTPDQGHPAGDRRQALGRAGEGSDPQPVESPPRPFCSTTTISARSRRSGASAGTAKSSSSCAEPAAARGRRRATGGIVDLDVEFVGVTKAFGDFVAVDDISFAVAKGSFFSLLGPSGCGKSTTLAHDQRLRASGPRRAPHRRRGHGRRPALSPADQHGVPALGAVSPHDRRARTSRSGSRSSGWPRREIRERVGEALELVGLGDFAQRKPSQLSGGQMQRVALARALVKRPKVLLLDEPLGALDLKLRTQMQLELKRIQREVGTTFIYVTHDQGEAMTMSDRIAVMNKGRIEQIDTPQEIYDRPATRFVAGFIGNTNIAPVTIEVGSRRARRACVAAALLSWSPASPASRPAPGISRCATSASGSAPQPRRSPLRHEAIVRDVIFGGSVVQYVLFVEQGPLELIAEQAHEGGGALLARGERVAIGWDAAAPRLFPDG